MSINLALLWRHSRRGDEVDVMLLFSVLDITCDFLSLTYPMQIQLEVNVYFKSDQLQGHETTEICVEFIRKLEDVVPAGDD